MSELADGGGKMPQLRNAAYIRGTWLEKLKGIMRSMIRSPANCWSVSYF